jgi:hypothetical protein
MSLFSIGVNLHNSQANSSPSSCVFARHAEALAKRMIVPGGASSGESLKLPSIAELRSPRARSFA